MKGVDGGTGRTIRVLHAEDDPSFRELVADVFDAEAGVEIVPEATPADALARLRGEQFDCVLSDYDAGEPGAFRPLIEATEDGPPCILLTGKDRDRVDAATSAAVDDYVRKGGGNRLDALVERVRNHAERYRSTERYRALFEEGAGPMVIHDAATGEVIDANAAYASLMGYDSAATASLELADIATDGEEYTIERAMDRLRAAADGGSHTFEWVNVTADGESIPVEVRLERMDVAGAGRVLATVRDISDRKRREAALERLNDAATRLLGTEDPGTVHDEVLAAAESVLEPSFCALVIREDERLVPVGVGGSDPNAPTEPLPLSERPEWEAIQTGETRERSTDAGRVLCVPLDDHGVLCLRGCAPDDDSARELAETLCSHAAVALDRADREAQLRERSRRRESLAVAFPDYVFFFDGDYVYREAWLATEHESRGGQPEEVLLGDHVGDHLDDPAATKVRAAIDDAVATGEVQEVEYAVEERTRTSRFAARAAPLPEDGNGGPEVVLVARDVTTQREYERRLEAQNERLDEFASMVSHDLRNPLNVVQGRIRLAASLAENEAVSEHVEAAESAATRMNDLIDDMLTMARTEERELTFAPVSVRAAAERAWATVSAPEATLELRTDGAQIRADEGRLIRLFENFFRNSVEHGSEAAAAVTVRVESMENGFAVVDDGSGIPDEHRDRVFESGYSTADDGTGYGLDIVERVADAHGWSVSLAAAEDGARFEVTGVTFVDDADAADAPDREG